MQLKIKVLPSNAFDTFAKRKHLASMLAMIVAGAPVHSVPYMVSSSDDTEWVLDSGNDWRVQFDRNDFCYFHLWHRYNDIVATNGLTQFVAYKIGGKAVKIDDPAAPLTDSPKVMMSL